MQLALDVPKRYGPDHCRHCPGSYTHRGQHRELISVMKQTKLNGINRMNEAEAMLKDRIPDLFAEISDVKPETGKEWDEMASWFGRN